MTIKHELRTCPGCGGLVTVGVKHPNHVLHALMSLLTLGLWLPIWGLAGLESLASHPNIKKACHACSPRKSWWK